MPIINTALHVSTILSANPNKDLPKTSFIDDCGSSLVSQNDFPSSGTNLELIVPEIIALKNNTKT